MKNTLRTAVLVIAFGLLSSFQLARAAGTVIPNFSALVQVPSGLSGLSSPLGFIVSSPTSFLLRAIGPSLASFGVKGVVAQPQLRFFDSTGKEIFYATGAGDVGINWPAVFLSVGAFQLTATGDWVQVITFPAGAYTVSISDTTHTGGTALLEFYQSPTIIFLPGTVVVP